MYEALRSGLRSEEKRVAALAFFRTFRFPPHSLEVASALANTLWALDSPAFTSEASWVELAAYLQPSLVTGTGPPREPLLVLQAPDDPCDIDAFTTSLDIRRLLVNHAPRKVLMVRL